MEERTKRILSFFENFEEKSLLRLGELYDPQIRFTDPLVRIEGLDQLQIHFAKLFKRARDVGFYFKESFEKAGSLATFWEMHFYSPYLNRGREVKVSGASMLKFDCSGELIIEHNDVFDIDALLYSNLPVLKQVLVVFKKLIV